jgi:RNA polymerase sigma factor (sigma-70 family)
MPTSDAKMQPHRDRGAWPSLVQNLSVEAILVLISSWMGPRLRRLWSPEDLWQETLFLAWRDRDQHEWKGVAAYRRWILGIARNRVREATTQMLALKRGGGNLPRSLSSLCDSQVDGTSASEILPPHSETPSRILSLRERRRAMEAALRTLPEEFGQALRSRLFEQKPLKEVAEGLGVSLATAKKRVYLGAQLYRKALRAALSQLPGVTPKEGE